MSELIETLAGYVPSRIICRLAEDSTPIAAPISERFPAAVLFADISGFTALTERLARRGPVGAEELSNLLNTYFGQLIDLITIHGGDIVKFAGDALIALWPAGDEAGNSDAVRLSGATLRAAQCGLIIQEYLNAYQVTSDAQLSLRLALGAGEILTMHLGGEYGRWEFLVTGAPLVQVGLADEHARPGDVVLSPEAWKLVHDSCSGLLLQGPQLPTGSEPESGDTPAGPADSPVLLRTVHHPLPPRVPLWPTPPPQAEAGLRAYIPGAILARLAAGQGGWLAELRRITILFVNLPDLDYTMPLNQAQSVMRALQTALYRYEGSVNKLSVDDKGVTFIAALGLPPLAHEDDPVRGVQAGLAMQATLRQMGLRSAVGVTTGRAFCGSVGNDTRREYTMIGDVVNLSARLMQAAPNDILCDAATYQTAQRRLNFDTLDPIKVKGKAEPVAVYRPRGKKEVSGRQQTEMVNRQEDRARLADRLQALLAGAGSVVIIEGETGIGKSCLAADLLRQAQPLGITTLAGGGNAIEKSTPYHAWRPIFRQFFKLESLTEDLAQQREQVMARLQADFTPRTGPASTEIDLIPDEGEAPERWSWEWLVPLLNTVLPLDWPENELTRQMTGKVRADNTLEMLVSLLQQAVKTGRPHLLVLDDAHWLDSASWSLARLVVQRVQPTQLVIVTRPMSEPLPAEYSHLRNAAGTERIILDSLLPVDTTDLVCRRLNVTRLPEALAQIIHAKTGGNPFFAEELTYALRDAGLLKVTNGQCHLAPEAGDLQSLHWPDTVQGVITSRIDRLSPSQQLTLKVASVIGRSFEYHTLHDIHPIDADKPHLVDYLDSLDKMEITELETPEPDLAYIFKQLTIQEVTYNMMLFSQRRELHRAVAEWYEETYADELSPFYSLLAYHWRSANVVPKALDYLEKAGEQALTNYANEEAIDFFSEAIRLAKNKESPVENSNELQTAAAHNAMQLRVARWQVKLGEAYVNWAKLSQGQAHLEQGLVLFDQGLPQTKLRLLTGLAGQVWQQVIHRLWPGRYVGRQSEQREVLLEAARACEGLTAVYYFANKTVQTLYAAFRSLNLAEAAGPSPELARGYTSVGAIVGFIPVHWIAQLYCRRALEAADNVDNLSAQTWAFLGTGMYYAGVSRWAKAQHLFGQVIDISERLGDRNRRDDGVGNLAIVTYFQGRFRQSARLSAELYSSAKRRQDAHNRAWALRSQVYCLLPQGEFSEALNRLIEIENILTQNPNIVDEALNIDLHGLLALVHLRQAKPEPALAAANNALALMAQTSPTSYLSLPGYGAVAETYLTVWEMSNRTPLPTFKAEAARRACKALRSYARVFPIGRPQAYLWRGLFQWLSGHRYLARRLWTKSLTAAERLAMPYPQALAHYQIGRHLPPADPARTKHLRRAIEILEGLEAAYDLERVKQHTNEPT